MFYINTFVYKCTTHMRTRQRDRGSISLKNMKKCYLAITRIKVMILILTSTRRLERYWTVSFWFHKEIFDWQPTRFILERREWRIWNRFQRGLGCCKQQMDRCTHHTVTVQIRNHVLTDCHLWRFSVNLRYSNSVT